jgi:predicted O-methyltransferase YrrM
MDAPLPNGLVQDWKEFLSGDNDIEDLYTHPVLFPLQRQREMKEMLKVASTINPSVIMEIGSDKGGSVFAWCKNNPFLEKMIVCEIRGVPYVSLMAEAFPSIQFLPIEASSYDPPSVLTVQTWLGEDKIDVLFIDGDKSYFDLDFEVYLPLMRKGGIVFMHDVNHRPMTDAFDKCKQGRKNLIIEDATEWYELRDSSRSPLNPHEHWLAHWEDKTCTVGVIYCE